MRRSMLVHGLKITLSRPRAVLWTYIFNLGIALLFSWRLNAQLDSILSHSLASQRLTSAFDLGVLAGAVARLNDQAPSIGTSSLLGPILYLVLYFLLIPGTLFTYQTAAPARLAILFSIGLQRFWRFLRITLLALLTALVLFVPLGALQAAWATHVDTLYTGYPALLRTLPGYLLLALIACLIRLYYDLVEGYTIQLGEQLRPDGLPDRRVRRVLLHALRTLSANLPRALTSFFSLTLIGLAVFALTARVALHTLAQPRVWPAFVLAQAGLLTLLFTRFSQRGAETVLVCDFPLPSQFPRADPLLPFLIRRPHPKSPELPSAGPTLVPDPLPNPEPASPSLSEPDPRSLPP